MKIKISFITLLFLCSLLNAQTTTVPDVIFEDYLETHSSDGVVVTLGDAMSMGDGIANNGLVLTNRIENVTTLNIIDLEIASLIGIEDFTSLETLVCNNNKLTDINVSSNASLRLLNVSNNRITGELVVSSNLNLESLFCSANQINVLDVSSNTVLKNINASNNALTSIDLSNINTTLCPDPQTDPLTLCQDFGSINVSRNQLSSLIVANGYNNLFTTINSTENPNLFCIQIDSDFIPSNWVKDDWTYYSETTCVDIYTYVPDDNFEQALIDLGYDDSMDNLVLTANINTLTNLNISNASISSLIGIEDFLALEILDCSTNAIESLDLSFNTFLQQIDVTNNDLLTIDLSTNMALTTLYCASNLITSIDLTANTALSILNCSNNALTNLNVSDTVFLSDLDCSFNQLESLNVTSNTSLINLLCNDNNLFALTINNGNNNAITTFNAVNNANLFCIQVDDVAFSNTAADWQKDASASYNLNCGTYIPDDNFEQALIDLGIDSDNTLNNFVATTDINSLIGPLDVSGLSIADLTGIQDFVALQGLNCSNNNLSVLNLDTNVALVDLDCSNNQIENLNLISNALLSSILCNDNALLTLDIENGNNGSLTIFNATNNPALFCINVDDAIAGSIPVSWQKDDFAVYNGDCVNNRFTSIPDAFFEQALIDLGYDNVIDGQVSTSNIEHVLSLNVSQKSISDLSGIRDFKSLVELDCSGNFLNELDVSGMLYLERLNCNSNDLVTNDINEVNGLFNTTGTISLRELYCVGNNLNNLDTSININLEVLDCADNNLSVLNINTNGSLRVLNCSNNDLTNLDISSNGVIESVNCNSNQISDLTTSNIINNSLTDLSCSNNSLSNLLINNYLALSMLNCVSNDLMQLDVTSNIDLASLSVSNNQISDIDLQNNINLIEALLSQNNISQINVSANTLLENLNCDFNAITQLDLNSNALLKILSCSSNQLEELDLSNNINLIDVNCSSNMLMSIVLSNNLNVLKAFNVSSNQIEGDIDLSSMAVSACVFQVNQAEFCPETISINVSNNLLSFVNIQNGINEDIVNFNSTLNPNLTCIQVDDQNNIGQNWIKDDTASYNVDCNFGETYVPDDNFEQTLIDLGYDSGPLNDYVSTANIQVLIDLDISGNSITDITGLQDFTALENLNCSNNSIIELDVSSNTNLLSINCSNNLLVDLDVTNNVVLSTLNCSSNTLSTLNLNENTSLLDLNINDNAFLTFTPSNVLSLQVFNCDNNDITELDFQQNQNLTSISCQFNLLETLNVKNGQNAILANLNALNNPNLLCIETDDGTVPTGATWTIDTSAQFAVNCFFGETYVPDDNFEQALINLGYDSGALDDYVLTENINDVIFLNISTQGILDLTGIEAFISLTSLDFQDNNVADVDLSNNTLLVNLDASGNFLTNIDIASLSDLVTLDVSNNSLTMLNFQTNLNLVDIDVSINSIIDLVVDELTNLEELNCASNQLSSLNVSQNPNLSILFCQSNLFINDQLNLQNGNNQNLQIFSAVNNPDLGCILVDDPVAVITNTDGIYDNWNKDDTASYQTICEDADNDGVSNEDDLCPNTEFGAVVDLFGCAYINLPIDNFLISITGETCLNSNNGKITITAQELYNYSVTLVSEDFNSEYNFTNDIDILNLLAGTYEMCITIEEWPDYLSCYTIVITEPNPLSVFASRTISGNEVSVNMSGSSSYNIEFNGESFTTHNSIISLELEQGINHLKVSTDLECQGVYEERIMLMNDFLVYPNPFNNQINVFNGIENEEIAVKIYSVYGQLVLSKTFINQNGNDSIDTSSLANGMYVITMETETMKSILKILKK